MSQVDIKIPKKVVEVRELLHASQQRSREYNALAKVEEQPLPPHKARRFEQLLAEAFLRLHQATGKFRKAYEKLKESDRRILADLERAK